MENYELAIVEFEKAKRLFPNIPTIYLNLGSLYKKQENYTKVRENWEKLLELNPDFPQKENILAELARMPK
jgi:tetratricopeptide (TPR) repeat protein